MKPVIMESSLSSCFFCIRSKYSSQ